MDVHSYLLSHYEYLLLLVSILPKINEEKEKLEKYKEMLKNTIERLEKIEN